MSEYLYLVQMDVPPALEADFNRIYDTQHIPEISKVLACSRSSATCWISRRTVYPSMRLYTASLLRMCRRVLRG